MSYIPQPIDTSHIAIDASLEALIEKLARNVHDVWARERMAEGWTWGAARNEANKQSPFLVDYAELPESEKDYDRRTAMETLKLILSLGYRIEPPAAVQPADESLHALRLKLATREALPLKELQSIWAGRDAEAWRRLPRLHLSLGERLVRLSEPLLAYDVLAEGMEAFPADTDTQALCEGDRHVWVRLRQLQGRALAQGGLTQRANEVFSGLLARGQRDGETLGMLARTYKDLGRQALDATVRLKHYHHSQAIYHEAWHTATAAGDPDAALYNGINAASLSLLCGQGELALELACAVERICREKEQAAGAEFGDYWVTATLGEAALIQGRMNDAEEHYALAAQRADGHFGDVLSMRRQCQLLLAHLAGDPTRLDACFPMPHILLLTGCEEADPDGFDELSFDAQLEEALRKSGSWIGFVSPVTRAGILFCEAARRGGWEIHALLPFPLAQVRRGIRDWPDGEAWAARFERALDGAATLRVLGGACDMDSATCRRFAGHYLRGLALLKRQQLDTELHTIGPEVGDPAAPNAPRRELPPPFPLHVRAMLFADAKGYSKLNDRELALFGHHYFDHVAGLLRTHQAGVLSTHTAGDGLFFVFAGVAEALAFALDFRDALTAIVWSVWGLPNRLGVRISLDAGPVYGYHNPIVQRNDFAGSYVIRAARIEPITPPGHVYASEALAALAAAQSIAGVRLDYVGQAPLAKGYGVIPLYHVRRNTE